MYNDGITLESAKGASQLYLRNLDEGQIEYIKQLQVRFQEQRGTEAARKALFGFLDLEKRHKEQTEAGNKLNREYQTLMAEYERFRQRVSNYFKLMDDVEFTKDNLKEELKTPLVKEPAGSLGGRAFGQNGSFLERRTNGYTGS
jgi:hypothetical protein